MRAVDLLKPLGVFVLVILLVLSATAVLGFAAGGSQPAPDGRTVDGQSPSEWRPENVIVESDAENGTIEVDADTGDKRVLVDTRHANAFARSDLEPVVDALFESGYEVRFRGSSDDSGFGEASYNETLQTFDAVFVIAPTEAFSESEVGGLTAFARAGGRVVVLDEPTQTTLSSGGALGASALSRTFTGDDFTREFGMRVADGVLYNVEDTRNDNNFKSIYATTAGSGEVVSGVNRVSLDTAGNLVTAENADADALLTAVDGTQHLETRRTGEYTIAARNDNVVLVADSSFIKPSEIYDSDNERFVGNLLEFMVTGDRPDDIPELDDDDEFGNDNGNQPPETVTAP